jgi:fido (protein-threonine AMPylation protein)
MLPAQPCPDWEYRNHPQYATVVPARALELMGTLTTDKVEAAATAIDTRRAHKKLFSEVTPLGHAYYAGHYRGEDFPCLKTCEVGVTGDPRVGELPYRVAFRMRRLSSFIRDIITALDAETPITTKEELQRLVVFISRSFVDFLTIHPYVNGNGHAARTIMCSIMLHYGFPPVWRIDSHPQDPEYTMLISQHRSGNPEPLQRYILERLISN